ncbi:MAG: PEGA domain-containing protein [Deltaproteobacteria bacterium]|nr:PEGA domain-containing protein [Deltaproteobacteria bacterium]
MTQKPQKSPRVKDATPRPTESRVLRAVAIVDRFDKPRRDEWTGEVALPGRLDESSSVQSLPQDIEGGTRVKDVLSPPQRPRGPLERRLRLLTAILLLASSVALFTDAARLALQHLGEADAKQPWRAVPLIVESEPPHAEVFVGRRALGRTPITTTEACRGHVFRLHIQAPGYATWTWNGICPKKGPLHLHARLRAVSSPLPRIKKPRSLAQPQTLPSAPAP